jgi:hypothetical protein
VTRAPEGRWSRWPLLLVVILGCGGGAWRIWQQDGPDTLSVALLAAGLVSLGAVIAIESMDAWVQLHGKHHENDQEGR